MGSLNFLQCPAGPLTRPARPFFLREGQKKEQKAVLRSVTKKNLGFSTNVEKTFFFQKIVYYYQNVTKLIIYMHRVSMKPGIGHFFSKILSEQPKIPAKKNFFWRFFLNGVNFFYTYKIDQNVCFDSYLTSFHNISIQNRPVFILRQQKKTKNT